MSTARRMWRLLETLHAVVYFAAEPRAAMRDVGLRGFWMGYFAGRAAPLGAVSADVVAATFYNFEPAMVRRAIPDAWRYASPERIVAARSHASVAALRRIVRTDDDVAAAAVLARRVATSAELPGRPLYAAYASLPWPDDPLAVLWHGATLVREHRGDAHVASLLAAGVDGCQAHVLKVAAGGVDRRVLQDNRGWTDEAWERATSALRERGAVDHRGRLTDEGAELCDRVEGATDEAASRPWSALSEGERRRLEDLLRPLAEAVVQAGDIPYPNPMGLPRLDAE